MQSSGRFLWATWYIAVWLGSLTEMCQTCYPEVTQRRRFDAAPGHCRVMTLGKLFTHVSLSPSSIICYRLNHWDVNRHTARYTGPVFVVSQCKNWCLAEGQGNGDQHRPCLLYTSPSPRDRTRSRMPSSA